LALLWAYGAPAPAIHDEFAYLLGADTFAHGRLTNPPHPMSPFFASPEILWDPTYSPKYPPGQSLMLAAGQVLFGHPFYGVVLEGAAMIFLLCLMLCLWTAPWPAAIVSTALAVFFEPPMYWVNTYWGGCLAVCGAALLLIAVGWYRRSPRPFAGCIFAVGCAVLFVTRPYEGGVLVLALLVMGAWHFARARQPGQRRKLIVAVAYALPVLAVAGGLTAAHNRAVTGSPFTLAYQLYTAKFQMAPAFWFQPPRISEPAFPNPRLAAIHGWSGRDMKLYLEARDLPHGYAGHLRMGAVLIFGLLPKLPLLLLAIGFADRKVLFCLALLGTGVFAASLETWQNYHYMAPSVPALALLWGVLAERALEFRVGRAPVGAAAVTVIFFASAASPLLATAHYSEYAAAERNGWAHDRVETIRRLAAAAKPALVIVRYPSAVESLDVEWVYNGADIDRQPVILAHDLGNAENHRLLEYYPDRTAWLLTFDPNGSTHFLNPYPR
jgi:hypothetical protein